jgi:hypothetical protein
MEERQLPLIHTAINTWDLGSLIKFSRLAQVRPSTPLLIPLTTTNAPINLLGETTQSST